MYKSQDGNLHGYDFSRFRAVFPGLPPVCSNGKSEARLTKPPNCPVDGDHLNETVVEAVLSLRIDDLEPRLTRSGYDVRSLAEQFDAKPAEIPRLLRGDLDPARSRELMDEMRAAGLPT
jgi:hypothetical protein